MTVDKCNILFRYKNFGNDCDAEQGFKVYCFEMCGQFVYDFKIEFF